MIREKRRKEYSTFDIFNFHPSEVNEEDRLRKRLVLDRETVL